MSSSSIKILQVSNISPSATKDQVQTLFSYIGRVDECRLYPSNPTQAQTKFAYIKFERDSSVELGQHLTNVVFIDRALVCIPAPANKIPDEESALRSGPALPGQRQLPPNVTNVVKKDADGQEMLYTNDPTISDLGVTQYPPLPANTEPSKIEEIRRTVYIGNLEKECDGEALMGFLNATIGEVMYLRMAVTNAHLPCAYCYVEFSKQESVPIALQNSGVLDYNGRLLKIQHSRVAIIKPKQKTADQAMEEVEEAIRVNEGRGDGALGRAYSPAERGTVLLRRRSRSPRRRSVTPPPRRRSPSYDERRSSSRRRSRSRSPSKKKHKKRSKSREKKDRKDHKRDRSREKKRKRSRSRS